MQVSATSNISYQPVGQTGSFNKMKQLFQQLGKALESGDVTAAKEAYAELQKNAPASAANQSNPIADKIEALGKALDSGDVKSAQTAYSEVKQMLSQRPSGGGKAHGAGGPPPGGGSGKAASASNSSSSSSKVYDPKDANKDGTVSWKEEQDYSLKHPEAVANASNSVTIDSDSGTLDALA